MENGAATVVRKKDRMNYNTVFDLNGKTPPQAYEIEEAVLGALMLDSNALNMSIESLHREYFYKPEHQYVFDAILKLFQDSYPVDLETVVERLKKSGTLELAGGAYNVAKLTDNVVSSAHIEYHVRILSEKYIQRELIRTSTETITKAYDETTDVVWLLDSAEQKLMDINDKNFRSDYKPVGSLVSDAMKQIEELGKKEGGVSGQQTGFVALDRVTAGFQPGTLIILAARPGMGKTAFALSIAKNIAVDFKKPVAVFSLEMSGVDLAMRLISSTAEISGERLKKGDQLTAREREVMAARVEALNDAPLFIDDTPQLTIFELRAKCRRLKQQHPDLSMVVIDYLQLMQAGGEMSRVGNREQEISTISRQLKALSKELNLPVLALSQLSRAVETRGGSKEPQLSDLRESGAIEQDADIVMFIYRPEYYHLEEDGQGRSTEGLAEVNLAKHRSGAQARVQLRFVGAYARFENLPEDEQRGETSPFAMPVNEEFDQGGGGRITIDSALNRPFPDGPDGYTPEGGEPGFDEDAPF